MSLKHIITKWQTVWSEAEINEIKQLSQWKTKFHNPSLTSKLLPGGVRQPHSSCFSSAFLFSQEVSLRNTKALNGLTEKDTSCPLRCKILKIHRWTTRAKTVIIIFECIYLFFFIMKMLLKNLVILIYSIPKFNPALFKKSIFFNLSLFKLGTNKLFCCIPCWICSICTQSFLIRHPGMDFLPLRVLKKEENVTMFTVLKFM